MAKLKDSDFNSASGSGRLPSGGAALGGRLRLVRSEFCGPGGVGEMARSLGLPPRTWGNFEAGVAIPGHVLLAFLVATSVEPQWLLSGAGPRYRETASLASPPAGGSRPDS